MLFFIFIIIRPIYKNYKRGKIAGIVENNPFKMLNSLASGAWVKIIEENNNLVKKDYSNKILLNQMKFQTLQNQINPHFLYNSLDSVRGLAIKAKDYSTAEMVEALASFFRYNIGNENDIVELHQEIQSIRNYFIIQRYRFSNRFKLECHFDQKDSSIIQYMIPKLIIQPLVENAIFHGLEPKEGKGFVAINVRKTTHRLYISVADNGVGMSDAELHYLNKKLLSIKKTSQGLSISEDMKHKNIAIPNINQRIKSIFGEDFGLHISSTLNLGTEIELSLPFPSQIKDYSQ